MELAFNAETAIIMFHFSIIFGLVLFIMFAIISGTRLK